MSQRWKRLRWKTSGGINISKISNQCHSGAWGSNLPLNSADAAWMALWYSLLVLERDMWVLPSQSLPPLPLPTPFILWLQIVKTLWHKVQILTATHFCPANFSLQVVMLGDWFVLGPNSFVKEEVNDTRVWHWALLNTVTFVCVCVCVFSPHCIDASVDFHEITSPLWPKG